MTLRRRILLFYFFALEISFLIIGCWSWFEFDEQQRLMQEEGLKTALIESPMHEALEVILLGGVLALIFGIIGGGFLMRHALRPIEELTGALEKTDASNLAVPVIRSGNGDELDRMSAVFNAMKQRLGVSFNQAREFTLHASHELKTPLTIMHGTLEQMLDDQENLGVYRDRIASMLEEVQRLATIVGQQAFLANADAGQLAMTHEPVALDGLIRELEEDTQMLAASANITVALVVCEAVFVNGDRMRLRQLLLNLADNAVKYNQQDGSITLSLLAQERHAVFQISNTGPGLSPELRNRVFERFFRGDAAHTSVVEGSGLGLSIAESIARAHGGSIRMSVLLDGQTQMTVKLPLYA